MMLSALLAVVAAAGAAIDVARFEHPEGEWALEYPASWKPVHGMQALTVRPAGRGGERAAITFERYPLGRGSPADADAYAREALRQVGTVRRLESDTRVKLGGRPARRLVVAVSAELKGLYGEKLPGPRRSAHLIVPRDGRYYVLRLDGIGKDFDAALPEFERMAAGLSIRDP